jgi:hypothetical protein
MKSLTSDAELLNVQVSDALQDVENSLKNLATSPDLLTAKSKYLIAAVIFGLTLSLGSLINAPTAFAKVTVENNQQTNQNQSGRQVYSIDEWPEVQKRLCSKCQAEGNSQENRVFVPESSFPENRVSVPEPSSGLALLMIGGTLWLTKKAGSSELTVTKK